MKAYTTQLIGNVATGKLDAELAILEAVLADRKAKLGINPGFLTGDRVRFNEVASPGYMRGRKAVVKGFSNGFVLITVEDIASARSFRGRTIKVQPKILQRISG